MEARCNQKRQDMATMPWSVKLYHAEKCEMEGGTSGCTVCAQRMGLDELAQWGASYIESI